jgi:hypothetical protein
MSKHTLIAALPLAAMFATTVVHTPPAAAAGQQGMVVARDPQTGELHLPTAAQMKELAAQRPTTLAPPAAPMVVKRADGTRQVRLGEKGLVYSVVTKGANGKLTEQCLSGEHAADAALSQPAHTHNEEHLHEDR